MFLKWFQHNVTFNKGAVTDLWTHQICVDGMRRVLQRNPGPFKCTSDMHLNNPNLLAKGINIFYRFPFPSYQITFQLNWFKCWKEGLF